ncbi:hypothetical protein MARGE09_P0595 [Marinagarivorans cellulosilyticus]|uniref:Sulfatase-modifying factor enzyme-like domain-containing protein n=2 Tax=Marinagarivorans cellulosilyticus TaxID=2721545 RepID=A0AAN1WF52_9GAMM|nr:hypothetical protein MARGE09_P0595 [Marinagarivorans cellulosilyticus]
MTTALNILGPLFPSNFPNPLAIDYGEDRYGLFQTLLLADVQVTFRWCPPGVFLMGSPEDEEGRINDETQHKVTLTQGFWLMETAVTQQLWQAVMEKNPSDFKGDLKPTENVSWFDCQHFIAELNRSYAGLEAALPTEAQWEYACRAGTATAFSFGDKQSLTLQQANYGGKWDEPNVNSGTCDVYRYTPSPWGLYQMHGNVWEWCQDIWRDQINEDAIDPVALDAQADNSTNTETSEPEASAKRVLRGGSWVHHGRRLRSAYRGSYRPDLRNLNVGLRLSLGQGAKGAEPR